MGPRQSVRGGLPTRLVFAATTGLLVIIMSFCVLYGLNAERSSRQTRLQSLAGFAAEVSSLYLNHYRVGFHFLAADLTALSVPLGSQAAKRVLMRFKHAYPALVALAIIGRRERLRLSFIPGVAPQSLSWARLMRHGCTRFGLNPLRLVPSTGRVYLPLCSARGGAQPLLVIGLLPFTAPRHAWPRLAGSRGAVLRLVSDPAADRLTGAPGSGRFLATAGRTPNARGSVTAKGSGNGVPGFSALAPLHGYPLAAIASVPKEDMVAAPWAFVRLWLPLFLAILGLNYGMYRWALIRWAPEEENHDDAEGSPFPGEEGVEVALRSILDAIVTTDRNGLIEYLNPTAERMTGWKLEEVAGRPFNDIFPCLDEQNGDLLDPIPTCRNQRALGPEDALLFHRDGRTLAVERTAAPMRGGDGMVTGIVVVLHDVSEKRLLAARLAHEATHDPLTGLPNRTLFNARLQSVIEEADSHHHPVALLLVDLDGFKSINDTLGHIVGDQVLVRIGNSMANVLRSTDLLARLGGDEFAVILPSLRTAREVLPILRKLSAVFARPVLDQPDGVVVGGSIGIALYPADADDSDSLVRAADTAMYEAKAAGRNTYRFFGGGEHGATGPAVNLEGPMRRGLEQGEFELLCEPRVWVRDKRVVGFEVTPRWRHPVRGVLRQAEFMPAVADDGLMLSFTSWMVRAACALKRSWRDRDLPDVLLAISMTIKACAPGEVAQIVRQALEETRVSPSGIMLEIAEATLISRPGESLATLKAIKDIGVGLGVDHFGAGLSSLGWLKLRPVEALKIDRSFLQGVPGDGENEAIVRAIIALAHTLGLLVVGSGVDTAAQYEFLRGVDCDMAQGCYFGDALTAEGVGDYLAAL